MSADLTYVYVGIFEAHTNLDRVSSLRDNSQVWVKRNVGSFRQAVVRAYDMYTSQLIYWMCLHNVKLCMSVICTIECILYIYIHNDIMYIIIYTHSIYIYSIIIYIYIIYIYTYNIHI